MRGQAFRNPGPTYHRNTGRGADTKAKEYKCLLSECQRQPRIAIMPHLKNRIKLFGEAGLAPRRTSATLRHASSCAPLPVSAPSCSSPFPLFHPPKPPCPLIPHQSLLLPLHKLQRLILLHYHHATALIPQIPHPIALLRHQQHLGPERRADELAAPYPFALPCVPILRGCAGGDGL